MEQGYTTMMEALKWFAIFFCSGSAILLVFALLVGILGAWRNEQSRKSRLIVMETRNLKARGYSHDDAVRMAKEKYG